MSVPSIMVVENEALVALALEMTIEDLGWRVAALHSGVKDALAWLDDQQQAPSAALLDVNLGGEMVFPVADALAARKVPFAFATGYADVVSKSPFAATPTLIKPVHPEDLKQVLDGLLAAG
jgi:CheY-like chemotaxis protein